MVRDGISRLVLVLDGAVGMTEFMPAIAGAMEQLPSGLEVGVILGPGWESIEVLFSPTMELEQPARIWRNAFAVWCVEPVVRIIGRRSWLDGIGRRKNRTALSYGYMDPSRWNLIAWKN